MIEKSGFDTAAQITTFTVLLLATTQVHSTNSQIETVIVEGRKFNLIGDAISASEGIVGQQEIQLRPTLRTGDILEQVPGMVVSQHSGSGKANQYYLRGFNLDHGTDFATFVDNMPVNMRTHGHGQGYTDLNFIIPETIATLAYKKGPYYAEVGDFSGAGSAAMSTADKLEHGLVEVTIGEDSFSRILLMDSIAMGEGETIAALELNRYDGPWVDINEDIKKTNVMLKHSSPLYGGLLAVTFMGYDNSWNSADQIPERAVTRGIIDELGSLDTTVGGESSRYSLSADFSNAGWSGSAYLIRSKLNLWSNFTYFLDNQVDGDQFEQVDDRTTYGGQVNYYFESELAGLPMSNRLGLEMQVDDIKEVALYQTKARQRLGAVRSDNVKQTSSSTYWKNRIYWTDKLRTEIGARVDHFGFDVTDRAGINVNGVNLTANNGSTDKALLSLKSSIAYAISDQWEVYLSAGEGLHSNDARGTTITVDPADGTAVNAVDPLVESFGHELGAKGFIGDKLNISMALWTLELDSELLFVGDAGNTEASRASERQGIEVAAYYHFSDQWTLDIEYAYTDAEFSDSAPEGNEIPGSVENIVQLGLSFDYEDSWFGSLRMRHFGERPLIEDGSVSSDETTIWNLRVGYQLENWTFRADVINLTDSNDRDIDYFYASRLADEPLGSATEDVHYHVMEPRTFRLSAGYRF